MYLAWRERIEDVKKKCENRFHNDDDAYNKSINPGQWKEKHETEREKEKRCLCLHCVTNCNKSVSMFETTEQKKKLHQL